MNNIKYLGIIFLLALAACGGSSTTTTAPTVSSLKDALDATVNASGTAGVYPTSFTITFSEAMNDTSVTTGGNITASCVTGTNTPLTPAISVAASGTVANAYVVTVTDAYKYALMSCTLTVTTNVTSAGGTALATAAAYTFTNACAVGDDFNADSSSCWSDIMVGSTWTTWADILANALTFDTANSTINTESSVFLETVSKPASISSSGFSIMAYFKVPSTSLLDFIMFKLDSRGDDLVWPVYVEVGMNGQNCTVKYSDGSSAEFIGATHDCSAYSDYYIRVVADASSFTMEYSSDGTTWASYTDAEKNAGGANPFSWPANVTDFLDEMGASRYLSFEALNNSGSAAAEVDGVATSGVTVTGQY